MVPFACQPAERAAFPAPIQPLHPFCWLSVSAGLELSHSPVPAPAVAQDSPRPNTTLYGITWQILPPGQERKAVQGTRYVTDP
jgi:hypothetical protein